MKKLIFFLLSFSITSNSFAQGLYDGIWELSYGNRFIAYSAIQQNGNQVLAVLLYPENYTWEAVLGTLNNNTVIANSIVSPVSFSHQVIFNTPNSLTATQISCTPAYNCRFPNGAALTGTKIW